MQVYTNTIPPYSITPDCYMNTIDDMQKEKYFYDYYNMFEHNHDLVAIVFIIVIVVIIRVNFT